VFGLGARDAALFNDADLIEKICGGDGDLFHVGILEESLPGEQGNGRKPLLPDMTAALCPCGKRERSKAAKIV
jgi:hypothetical protein